jgi:hypothetical protein
MLTQTDVLLVNHLQQDTAPTSSTVSEHVDFYWVCPFNRPCSSNPEIGRPRRTSPDTSPINTKSSSRGATIPGPFSTYTEKKVTKLCGHEPLTKYLTLAVVTFQFLVAIHLRSTPFFSVRFFLTAYLIGATANQNLFLAIHEISHNLAFKSQVINRYFAVFANLPIGLPYSAAFRPYHLEHHKFLGIDGIDTDLPTRFEARFLQNVLGKAFFW